MRPELPVPEHGWRGYKRGCRCVQCTREHTARTTEDRDKRYRRLREDPDMQVEHGTANTYQNWGCRCDECYVAYSDYQKYVRVRNGYTRNPTPLRRRFTAEPFGREWMDA